MRSSVSGAIASLAAAVLLLPLSAWAQQSYQEPPAAIRRILDAAPAPTGAPSPDGKWIVVAAREAPVTTIADMSEPTLYLAGLRVKPTASFRVDTVGIRSLALHPVSGGAARTIPVPAGGRIAQYAWARDGSAIAYTTVDRTLHMGVRVATAASGVTQPIAPATFRGKLGTPMWSGDGRYVAFTESTKDGTALWIADAHTHSARQATGYTVNPVNGGCEWLPHTTRVLCRMNVATRGVVPAAPDVPAGPIVQESYGRKAPVRTIEYLLKSPYDEQLFDHYFTNQLTLVDPSGHQTPIGAPGVHVRVDPSPDGRWLLVQTVHRPYSYQVDLAGFPRTIAVWSMSGHVAKVIADRPLMDDEPSARDAVVPGVRVIAWRPDVPATLYTVEALDRGDPRVSVPRRDRIALIAAPFTSAAQPLLDTELRYRGVDWLGPDLALVNEGSSKTAKLRTWLVNPASPSSARVLWDRSSEDRYADPGQLARVYDAASDRMVPLRGPDGHTMYLTGNGASPTGDRPFLDALDVTTGTTKRLWQNSGENFEYVASLTDPTAHTFVTRRETPSAAPNFFRRELSSTGISQLTQMGDPAPEFAGVSGTLITYTRPDGVKLSATMYLPPGYTRAQGRLPFFFWAYPREFLSADAASQVQGSPYQFKRPVLPRDRHLLLLAAGYGVLDGPTMPIVARNGKEPNDSYIEQLVASAKAAIDAIDSLGVGDRNRVAVGGHSYGAFMTANLLAHSSLFRAGVAESGAYNRTLTPFGFQAEPRTYWQAPEIYNAMSPFNYADKLKTPILLIHGMNDDNSGTFPINSERLYAALKGNGGTVRYVQLPLEPHGYTARETLRHVTWETVTWLDKYVKNAAPAQPAPATTSAATPAAH